MLLHRYNSLFIPFYLITSVFPINKIATFQIKQLCIEKVTQVPYSTKKKTKSPKKVKFTSESLWLAIVNYIATYVQIFTLY